MSLPNVDRNLDGQVVKAYNEAGHINSRQRAYRLYKKYYALSLRKKKNLLKRLQFIKVFNAV